MVRAFTPFRVAQSRKCGPGITGVNPCVRRRREAEVGEGILAEAFADGCVATFDHFYVRVAEAALVDGNATD